MSACSFWHTVSALVVVNFDPLPPKIVAIKCGSSPGSFSVSAIISSRLFVCTQNLSAPRSWNDKACGNTWAAVKTGDVEAKQDLLLPSDTVFCVFTVWGFFLVLLHFWTNEVEESLQNWLSKGLWMFPKKKHLCTFVFFWEATQHYGTKRGQLLHIKKET